MLPHYKERIIPRLLPLTDPVRTVTDYYSRLYCHEKSDSPDCSRVSLLRRMKRYDAYLKRGDWVLDLGGGRQILERQYIATYGKPSFNIVTLDIAKFFSRKQLLELRNGVDHIRANGSMLPFASYTFSLVVSNMALDFMPKEATDEVYKVLKVGGHGLINLHHPSLISSNLDDHSLTKRNQREVLNFWKYLRDNKILTDDPNEIRERFNIYGFQVQEIVEASDSYDKWWEIDLLK